MFIVGSLGLVTVSPLYISWGGTGLHQSVIKDTVIGFHLPSQPAYSVISHVIEVRKLNSDVNSGSEYQATNEYPVFIGSSGSSALDRKATNWEFTLLHPLELNVTVAASSHCA